jgi:glycine/D-amino acid oxidase-like deaminating enzyme
VQPEDFNSELSDQDRTLADSIIAAYSQVLREHRHGGRAFYDCYREDRTPLTAYVSGDSRAVFAGACAGSGFRLSPGLADRALDLLEAGEVRQEEG